MSEPTVILAILSVVSHCAAIFWPRKPLKVPLDENGFPILWCNDREEQPNITCVWHPLAEEPAPEFAVQRQERTSA
jgi:hypothetical protein